MKASVELLPTAEAALHRWERPLYAVNLHVLRDILKRKPFSASAARDKERTAVHRSSPQCRAKVLFSSSFFAIRGSVEQR